MRKLTYSLVKETIDKTDCELLSTSYRNCKTKLKLKCKCGNIFYKSFMKFKAGQQQCPSCGKKKARDWIRLSYEHVSEYIKNKNCTVLSKSYKNCDVKLKIKCRCGSVFDRTFYLFKTSYPLCPKCTKAISVAKQTADVADIRSYIENHNCKLISDYINDRTKLEIQCACGEVFKTSFKEFKFLSKRRCNNCSRETARKRFSFSYDYVREYIQNNSDCVLISDVYRNVGARMKFKCGCGKIFETTFADFKLGQKQCRVCSNQESRGECEVRRWLESNDVGFEQEKRFDDCRSPKTKNQRLPFDFYVKGVNTIIEYDGMGYFKPIRINSMSHENAILSYQRTIKNDIIKNKYCKDNGIKLIRIPYTAYKNISKILQSVILDTGSI